jgi:putative FmdB family regulatory protein
MPVYEFECVECGAEFETLMRKLPETMELKCPECGSGQLEQKLSRFASVAKGGSSRNSNCAPSGGG